MGRDADELGWRLIFSLPVEARESRDLGEGGCVWGRLRGGIWG